MQAVVPDSPDSLDSAVPDPSRGLSVLTLSAAALLAASVVLHVVAVFPQYYRGAGQGSLWSEPDQAAQYLLLAAGWALALALVLSGPARARVAAALAVGLAATEFGFRLSDLGEVWRYGSTAAGAGLWLMIAAWVAGAAGAVLAVLAARAGRPASEPAAAAEDGEGWGRPEADLWARRAGTALSPEAPADDATSPLAASSDVTRSFSAAAPDATEQFTTATATPVSCDEGSVATGPLGAGPTILVVLLALATAGAFLPAWDHYSGVATATGRTLSFNLGDAFSGPWQVVWGTIFVAVALVVVPVLATRMHNRAAGAALVAGSLIVLGTQFISALVQVDKSVPPSVAGLSPSQANQLGLQLHMTLTGWFTLDLLAAFALFVVAMVFGHLREAPSKVSPVGPAASHLYAREPASAPPS